MNRGTVMILLVFAGFGATEPGYGAGPEPVPEVRPGILQGYLSPDAYPDSLALLPPPPAEGTAAHEADEALNRRLLTLMKSSRFELAALDSSNLYPLPYPLLEILGGKFVSLSCFTFYLLKKTAHDPGGCVWRAGSAGDTIGIF